MTDSSDRLPPSLRVPAGGDLVSLTWSVDLGPGARLDSIAQRISDLQAAVDVGERWGTAFARTAAEYQLLYEVARHGPDAVVAAAREFRFGQGVAVDFEEWLFEWAWWRPRRHVSPFWGPEDVVRVLADGRTPDILGTPTQTSHIEYRNPLEVVLTGSGFLIAGTIYVLRMVRDWSSKRREGAAVAQAAEAAARQKSASAEMMEWLVEEARAGRLHMPPGDLLAAVSSYQTEVLHRLAEDDVQLQLPAGTDARRESG